MTSVLPVRNILWMPMYLIHVADQPCTRYFMWNSKGHCICISAPSACWGECILCFTDISEIFQLLTSAGLQSLINNCQITSVSHVTEYLDQRADAQHFVHRSFRLKIAYQAKKAKRTTAVSKESAHVLTHSATGTFRFNDVFLLCSVRHRLWQSRNKTGYDWARVWWNSEGIS